VCRAVGLIGFPFVLAYLFLRRSFIVVPPPLQFSAVLRPESESCFSMFFTCSEKFGIIPLKISALLMLFIYCVRGVSFAPVPADRDVAREAVRGFLMDSNWDSVHGSRLHLLIRRPRGSAGSGWRTVVPREQVRVFCAQAPPVQRNIASDSLKALRYVLGISACQRTTRSQAGLAVFCTSTGWNFGSLVLWLALRSTLRESRRQLASSCACGCSTIRRLVSFSAI
jgi:hypothetical protein